MLHVYVSSYISYAQQASPAMMNCSHDKKLLAAVGFEPTPPERLVPKTSALDRSATLPSYHDLGYRLIY